MSSQIILFGIFAFGFIIFNIVVIAVLMSTSEKKEKEARSAEKVDRATVIELEPVQQRTPTRTAAAV